MGVEFIDASFKPTPSLLVFHQPRDRSALAARCSAMVPTMIRSDDCWSDGLWPDVVEEGGEAVLLKAKVVPEAPGMLEARPWW